MKSFRLPASVLLLAGGLAAAAPSVRIKDIAALKGVRSNQLMGIGLVVGLSGRGDSSGSPLLKSALSNLVSNFGFRIAPEEVRSRNCAVVSVSAEVPAFVRAGENIDVKVSSLGDARSLEGGILLQTPLKAANGRVYALAQGQVFTIGTGTGQKTVGTVPGGAITEQEILSSYTADGTLSLVLRHPDFVTASSMAAAIRQAFANIEVRAVDASLVELTIPADRRGDPVGFIAQLESLAVTPDASGTVVIDAATGIVVFGEKVRIGKVAVSYRDVSLKVGPAAFALPQEEAKPEQFVMAENTSVEELVNTLRAIGLETQAIIQLLIAIDRAGALYGKLIVL